jgi:hypothetical protein
MEHCFLVIKISRRDGLQYKQIHLKLLKLYGGDGLSYSEVCYWSKQFLMGLEYVEDPRRTGRPVDFGVQLRIQSALEEMPLGSVQCITEARSIPALTVF